MKAIYDNKIVKVVKIMTANSGYVTHPILIQVKVEWKENGKKFDSYVNANKIEFINK